MNELALFAGGGGGILGGRLLGWHTVAAVEIEKYPREILLQRQRDGILPRFPIWDDVCSFDGRPWRGCVDVISGGFPCQDISVAGKGADELDAGAEVADSASERFQASKRQFANLSQEAAKRASDGAAGDCEDAYAADADVSGCEEQWGEESDGEEYAAAECGLWWSSEPSVGRVADGVAYRVDRLRAIGNGQVPLVAAVAFCELKRILEGEMTYGVD